MINITLNLTETFYLDNIVGLTVYLWVAPVIGMALNIVLFLALQKMNVLPSPVLLQLQHLTLVFIITCAAYIIIYGCQLISINFTGFVTVNRVGCVFWAVPGNMCQLTFTASFAYLALERWNSTKNELQASKEGSTGPIKLALLVIWIVALLVSLVASVSQIFDTALEHHFCGFITFSVPRGVTYAIIVGFLGSQVTLLALYWFVWLKNHKKLAEFSLRTTSYSVIQRYQMRQTLKSFRMVAPSLIIGLLVNIVLATYILIVTELHQRNLNTEVELGLLAPLAYSALLMLHPLTLYQSDKDVRARMRAVLCCRAVNTVGNEATAVTNHALSPNNNAIMLDTFWHQAIPHP